MVIDDMHVLIVPSWYPNDINKISGSFFKEQAEALAKNDIKVTVLSLILIDLKTTKDVVLQLSRYKPFCLRHNKENGVNTYYVNVPTFGLTRLNMFYNIYAFLFKLYYNKIRNAIDKVDIVHAHSFKYAGYAMCRVLDGIPMIITEHLSNIVTNRLNRFDIKNLSFVVQKVNKFICVSNFLKNCIINYTVNSNKIIVISNMVNSIFEYKNDVNSNSEFVFSSVSGLVACKRVDLLIRSFYLTFKNESNIKLKIVGDGPKRRDLQRLIDELKLNDQVELLGQLERHDIFRLYQESNAFVMVSKYETFGLVYAESLMCGLPTIGTRNGGAEDILNCYGGFLCANNDIDDISSKMKYVYKNYSKFDRKKISDNASTLFSDSVVTKKIINVYKECINS